MSPNNSDAPGEPLVNCKLVEDEETGAETEALLQQQLAIGRRCARILQDVPAADHGHLLFDERGLPR